MKSVSFIGAGNMASAIVKGMHDSKENSEYNIRVYDVMKEKAAELAGFGAQPAETVEEAVTGADYLVLAVKPQNFEEVLTEIRSCFSENTVVVSIAAGITADYIKQVLGCNCKVVLVMPNTPLLLGMGATALACVQPTGVEEFSSVCRIFKACGEIAVIPEEKMREVIALNGSSPAFIYLFAKGFMEYAEKAGIEETAALSLFCQSLKGAAEMMLRSDQTIDELIEMVSSKGGTTVAGLERFRENGLIETVQDACEHCTKRAYELSKE